MNVSSFEPILKIDYSNEYLQTVCDFDYCDDNSCSGEDYIFIVTLSLMILAAVYCTIRIVYSCSLGILKIREEMLERKLFKEVNVA